MKIITQAIVLTVILLGGCSPSPKDTLLYIGTYTDTGSEGIYCYQFNEESGELTSKFITPHWENPSFLTISPDQKYLYAVSEVTESPDFASGSVSAYQILDSGELEKINQQATGGLHPCHVTVSPDGQFVVASNYSSGSLSCFECQADGGLQEMMQLIQHAGTGADSVRQSAPHAHSALFTSNGLLVSADLGTDQLDFYHYDERAKEFEPAEQASLEMNPGAGPRHFSFSPDEQFIYVANELDATISVLKKEGAKYELLESVSSVPEDFSGVNYGADVHLSPNGRFVYCSNRGHNSIAVFERSDDGRIRLLQTESVRGDWPRNFTLSPDGRFLLVANQKSNNITVFWVDQKTGLLTYTGNLLELMAPVCLQFLER